MFCFFLALLIVFLCIGFAPLLLFFFSFLLTLITTKDMLLALVAGIIGGIIGLVIYTVTKKKLGDDE